MGVAFALYQQREGGAPLWMETHNVEPDEQGRYAVLLGSTGPEGLSPELFARGEARWLGIQVQIPGEEERARVLLVSVPYALKAADADTLGGKPLSAFVLVESPPAASKPEAESAAAPGDLPGRVFVSSIGRIAKFIGTNNETGDSVMSESNGWVGFGTTSPSHLLHVAGTGIDGDGQITAKVDATATVGQARLQLIAGQGTTNRATRVDFLNAVASPTVPRWTLLNDYLQNGVNDLNLLDGSNSRVLVVKQGGAMGIGVGAPAHKLEVLGNVRVWGTGNGIIFPDGTIQTTACGALAFGDSGHTARLGAEALH
ncbi:MAG: hypothetical protein ACREUU_11835, partial [Gammaproteobacteria bacterium]